MKVENSNSTKEKQKIVTLLVIACIKHLLVFTVKVS